MIIKISETTEKPEIIDPNEYCNIVSTKNGEIVKITANVGTPVAKVRRYCVRRKYSNWGMDGRKLYRN